MRFPGDASVGDWIAGAIALGCGLAVLVLAFAYSKWVIVGAGLFFFMLWAGLRVETGRWIDDFDEIEVTLRDPAPTEERPAR